MIVDSRPLLPRALVDPENLRRLHERALVRLREEELRMTRRWSLQRLALVLAGAAPAVGLLTRTQRAFAAGSLRNAAPQYGAPPWPATPTPYIPPVPVPPPPPKPAPNLVTTRGELGVAGSWVDETAKFVVPAMPGRVSTTTNVRVKTIIYRTASAGDLRLTAISDPHTKYTYVVRGAQTFYVSDDADMIVCLVGSGSLEVRGSLFRTITSDEGDAPALARFATEVDDYRLLAEDGRVVRIDLTPGVPSRFWTGGATPERTAPLVSAIHVSRGLLRLDVMGDTGGSKATFWVDLKEMKLLKTAVDGKEVM